MVRIFNMKRILNFILGLFGLKLASKRTDNVKEFHQAFGHPINKTGAKVDRSVRQLRVKLIFEELQELAVASDVQQTFAKLCFFENERWTNNSKEDGDDVNKVEELDALGDISYVTDGSILANGHHENFDEAYDEIHSSNMSKMCNSLQEVEDTILYYTTEKGEVEANISYKPDGDKFIVYRTEDGKVFKNVHYKPANLEKYT